MDPIYGFYVSATSGLFTGAFPAFWLYSKLRGRYRKGLRERLGFVPLTRPQSAEDTPRIWMHAVSLGEVKVASSIHRALKGLLPNYTLIVSTTTEHGRDLALETFQDALILYSPIDVIFCVRKALSRVRPDVMVFLETEIWPAWITEARRMGAKVAMINGRISPRTFRAYLRLRPFLRKVLAKVDVFSMIRKEDADRIGAMGAPPNKIRINGNAKYDLLSSQTDPTVEAEMRRALNIAPSQQVLVAGSTRGGEEAMILDVYKMILKHFPDTLLFIAPRHIDRTPEIEALIRNCGFKYELRSEMKEKGPGRTAPVVIMNTFGELFKLYSVGTINFCGASLVPLGGQNPLEPAAWGKVTFYGSSMEDFVDAKELLESVEGGMEVPSPEAFVEKALWFLKHPEELKARGQRAREAVLQNRHAARRHAKVIAGLL